MPSRTRAAFMWLASQATAQLCGTPPQPPETLEKRAADGQGANVTLPAVISVPVHFHSVAADEGGLLSVWPSQTCRCAANIV